MKNVLHKYDSWHKRLKEQKQKVFVVSEAKGMNQMTIIYNNLAYVHLKFYKSEHWRANSNGM